MQGQSLLKLYIMNRLLLITPATGEVQQASKEKVPDQPWPLFESMKFTGACLINHYRYCLPSVHQILPSIHQILPSVHQILPSVHQILSSIHQILPSVHLHQSLMSVHQSLPSVHNSPQQSQGSMLTRLQNIEILQIVPQIQIYRSSSSSYQNLLEYAKFGDQSASWSGYCSNANRRYLTITVLYKIINYCGHWTTEL